MRTLISADTEGQLLKQGADQFGISLSKQQLHLFSLFLEGLWTWNKRINLTGIATRREIIIKLLLEPLAALAYLPSAGTLLDVGSGAGIPGLPFKIARPDYEVHLLESKAKKVSFLKYIIRKICLKKIGAFQGRVEKSTDIPLLFDTYDIVSARALAPLPKTIRLCSPRIRKGGILVTFQGPAVHDALANSQNEIENLGFAVKTNAAYRLPETRGERHLLILKRVKALAQPPSYKITKRKI
ncbi:MAG: 16S rRNA (guanine(527)-N(7))-methyltransferase RsmG [Thermodesulfobacteriota bacterium]